MTPVRADHLPFYGYARDTAPNLERLAERGIVFERAYSQAGWTPPSHASLLTGLYPSRHGVGSDGTQLRRLDPCLPTLPGLLADRGYHTAGFLNSCLLGSRSGLDRGFREFYEVWRLEGGRGAQKRPGEDRGTVGALKRALDRAPRLKRLAQSLVLRSGFDRGAPSKSCFTRAEVTTRRVIAWLESTGRHQEPFFLFLHYGDPHYKCHAPLPWAFRYVSRFHPVDWVKVDLLNNNPFLFMTGQMEATPDELHVIAALYDAEIRYMDFSLGRLLAHLGRSGLLDHTLVIVLSHHGSSFGEHGLGSHVACLYEPLVHVPLIVLCPGMARGGARVPALVELTDIVPTVLELAGCGSAGLELDGRCLPGFHDGSPRELAAAEWHGEDTWYFLNSHMPGFLREALHDPGRRSELERFARSLRMLREGDYKYIAGSDGREELYDVAVDPAESRDLIAQEPERARTMAARLRSHLGPAAFDERQELDEEILKGLRDMGYRL